MLNVSDAARIYEAAAAWLAHIAPDAKFIAVLEHVRLVNYHNGIFTLEVPNLPVGALFSRQAERLLVEQAIAAQVPADVQVRVEFVLAGGGV